MATRRHTKTLTPEELYALVQEMAQIQLTILKRIRHAGDPTLMQAEKDLGDLCVRLGLDGANEDGAEEK